MKRCAFLLLLFWSQLSATSPQKIKTLYNSLDPLSIPQHLAFYELYPETTEGKQALGQAWGLLSGQETSAGSLESGALQVSSVDALVALVNKQTDQPLDTLNEQQLITIERLASRLPNRRLKGYYATSEEEVLALSPSEIDLARSLFLTQLGDSDLQKIRTYEASLDLMALQILTRLVANATPVQKIRAMNDYIFGEMGFRFPPHSAYAKDIDLYTFLPSVVDSRRGVCLGVSILYICLAQRLALPLQMITPPGHIYVRYCDEQGNMINIETTARGIHLDSEEYLSIETRSLQERTIKDVIGLAHFNQASVFWSQEKFEEAYTSYKKAQRYLQGDKLLTELLGYIAVLTGRKEEGYKLLEQVRDYVPDFAVSGDTLAADYLDGKTDENGIKAIFMHVDENRESILKKRDALQTVLAQYPQFRAGWFSLAGAWLQLHRQDESLQVLKKYERLDNSNPRLHYYLTALYGERLDYGNAWRHFRQLQALVVKRHHNPKVLKDLHRELALRSPE